MSSVEHDALRAAVLAELAAAPEGMSLPRLCKRLGVRMSVLLRELAWLGEDDIAGAPGAGLVRVRRDGERDIAVLTDAGRRAAARCPQPSHRAQSASSISARTSPAGRGRPCRYP
jgi:hypothetical protein